MAYLFINTNLVGVFSPISQRPLSKETLQKQRYVINTAIVTGPE